MALLIVIAAPLCVSGVMELLGLRRGGSFSHWPDVDLEFRKTEHGYEFFEFGSQANVNGEVTFDSLWRAPLPSGLFVPSGVHVRRILSVVTDTRGFLDPNDEEFGAIREALVAHLSSSGASAELIDEVAKPNVSRVRINWLGVYLNGVFAIAMVGPAVGAIGWMTYLLSPHAFAKRRHASGLCLECKYDLRGATDPGCPECGWRKPQNQIDQ